MSFAATYIKLLLQQAQASTAAPSPTNSQYNLPGLKVRPWMNEEELTKWKKEYNVRLGILQDHNKKLSCEKGKDKTIRKKSIKHAKEGLVDIRAKIGAMTETEATFGFPEVRDAE
jgi:hypothetical protein